MSYAYLFKYIIIGDTGKLLFHYYLGVSVSCDSPSPARGLRMLLDFRPAFSSFIVYYRRRPPLLPPVYFSPFIAVISHSPIPLFISLPGVGKSCLLLQVSLMHDVMTAVLNHSCALSLTLNAAFYFSSPTTAFNRFMT